MLAVLFAVMSATTISIQIFRNSIEDGTEILVLSKPLTRTLVLWTKVFVLFIWTLIISFTAGFASIFTIFTGANNDGYTAQSVILGSSIGTLIIFLVWSSISVFFSIFFKKFTVFIISMGIQSVLIVISIVFSVIVNPVANKLNKEHEIRFDNLTLIHKDSNNDSIKYQNVLVGSYKNEPITLNTNFNGFSLKKYGLENNEILSAIWNKANAKSNKKLLQAIDLEYQFASLLNIYNDKMLKSINLGSSYNKNSIIDSMFSNPLPSIALNLKLDKKIDYSWIYNNFKPISSNINNKEYTLISNGSTNFQEVEQKSINKTIPTPFKNNSGEIKNIKFDDYTYPIFSLDQNSHIQNKTFSNLEEFAKYYYSDAIDIVNKLLTQLQENANKLTHISASTIYFSLIASQLKQAGLSFKQISQKITDFQYLTYKVFVNQNQFNFLKQTDLNKISEVLNYSSNQYFTYKNPVNIYVSANIANSDNMKNWYYYTPQLSIIPSDELVNINGGQLTCIYNDNALISCWFAFSFIVFIISISLYSKKDFS